MTAHDPLCTFCHSQFYHDRNSNLEKMSIERAGLERMYVHSRIPLISNQ